MTSRQRTLLVVATAGLSYLAWVLGLVLAYRVKVALDGDVLEFLDSVVFSLAWVGFPAVGGILAIRRPDNPVGWMVLLVGFSMYAFEPVTWWAQLAVARGGELGGGLVWTVGIVLALSELPIVAFAHLLLFFPDGEMTRWSRVLSRVALAAAGLAAITRLLRPADLGGTGVANPFGVSWMPGGDELLGPLLVTLFTTALLALARLVARYRRAGGLERKQFQWVLASVATFPFVWLLGNALEGVNYGVGQFITVGAFTLAFAGLTIALYRAVTKHDLYGIDRLVSRSLSYAVLTAVLVLVYLGLVLGLGGLARVVTGESGDLVVALSTLAVAAIAQPLRRRVHAAVDRRFNRASYDAARTIDAFGRGLRDELGLEAIVGELRGLASNTFRPQTAAVVLVDRGPT